MSLPEDIVAANAILFKAKNETKMIVAASTASLAAATAMRSDAALAAKLRAVQALIKRTRAYNAGILAATDQLNQELRDINGGKKK
jgi:hypothetical protein